MSSLLGQAASPRNGILIKVSGSGSDRERPRAQVDGATVTRSFLGHRSHGRADVIEIHRGIRADANRLVGSTKCVTSTVEAHRAGVDCELARLGVGRIEEDRDIAIVNVHSTRPSNCTIEANCGRTRRRTNDIDHASLIVDRSAERQAPAAVVVDLDVKRITRVSIRLQVHVDDMGRRGLIDDRWILCTKIRKTHGITAKSVDRARVGFEKPPPSAKRVAAVVVGLRCVVVVVPLLLAENNWTPIGEIPPVIGSLPAAA